MSLAPVIRAFQARSGIPQTVHLNEQSFQTQNSSGHGRGSM